MISLLSLSFWWSLLLFLASIVLVCGVPGAVAVLTFKKNEDPVFQAVLALVTGIILWTAQGYIAGYLGIRFASYLYVAVCLGLLYLWRKALLKFCRVLGKELRSLDRFTLFLFVLGVGMQVLQMVGTGLQTTAGLPFYRVHVQDGIFHISLIQSIVRQFPPIEPGAVGVAVVNYHYWSDLFFAEFARVFSLPIHHLFFQFVPPVIAAWTGLSVIALVRKVSRSMQDDKRQRQLLWFALFFLFWGSDLAYLFLLGIHQTIGFHTAAIDNGATQFLNMPHTFAKLFFLCWMGLVLSWQRSWKHADGVWVALVGATMVGFKVYFGLLAAVVIAILGGITLLDRLRQKKSIRSLVLTLGLSMLIWVGIGASIYLPPNKGSGGLGWYPLEWPKLFVAAENLDWTGLRYKKAIAEYTNARAKVVYYDVVMIATTLLCIHGTRLLGGIPTKKVRQAFGGPFVFASLGATLLFTVLGLYTLQQSGGFNVFNFFASSLTVLALFSAWTMVWLLHKGILGKILVTILVLLTLPRIVFETTKITSSYIQANDVRFISLDEQDILRQLSLIADPAAVIQSHPNNDLDYATPYVSYFANRFTYASGQKVLETHNQSTLERIDQLKRFFSEGNPAAFLAHMRDIGVDYVYVRKVKEESFPAQRFLAEKIVLENEHAIVYDVR